MLSRTDIDRLYGILDSRKRVVNNTCKWRTCTEKGEYFARKRIRGNRIQQGKYCDKHEDIIGYKNLKKFARQVGGVVTTLRDSEGDYQGVSLTTERMI